MTQRVIVDLAMGDGRTVGVTVLLRPDGFRHVVTGADRDIARLQSAVVPFISSARRALERRAGRPPGTHPHGLATAHRIIVDLGTPTRSGVTVSVFLRPQDARHVFTAPDRNTVVLQSAIAPFVSRAHSDAARLRSRPVADVARPKRDRARPRAIRAWAQANGHKLPSRGRIPNSVVAAYESELAGRARRDGSGHVEVSKAG